MVIRLSEITLAPIKHIIPVVNIMKPTATFLNRSFINKIICKEKYKSKFRFSRGSDVFYLSSSSNHLASMLLFAIFSTTSAGKSTMNPPGTLSEAP